MSRPEGPFGPRTPVERPHPAAAGAAGGTLAGTAVTQRGLGALARRAWTYLPRGNALPPGTWRSRHRVVVWVLWVHVPVLFAFGMLSGPQGGLSYDAFGSRGWAHVGGEMGFVSGLALVASWSRLNRRIRSAAASIGLVTCSALLTHFSGGYIEAHFHFFVMIGVIATYQDWVPFLLSIAYVALHHGVVGTIDPASVYNHPAAIAHPWTWAAIHAFFILCLSAAELVHWRSAERSAARTELVLHSAGEGILGLDRTGRVSFANAAAAAMTGVPLDSLVGRPVGDILTAPAGAGLGAADGPLATLRDASVHAGDRHTLARGSGPPLPVEWVCNPVVERGALTGAVVSVRDTSERRRAHDERARHTVDLEHALSLQTATLEATADGILVVDTGGRITSFNRRFQEMWRIPDEVVASKDDDRAIGFVLDQVENPAGFVAKVRELYADPEAESFDVLRFKDQRTFERSSKPQRIGHHVIGRVWSFRDVTDRVRAQAELSERASALATSNAELERFAYVSSHDLREPLRMVTSYVQLLERRYKGRLDPDADEFIGFAVEGTRRMDEMLRDLLAYSRVDRESVPTGDVDCGKLLDEVLRTLEPALQEAGARVTHDPMPHVRGDRVQLGQVFQNLLSNAIKFRDPTESPHVHVSSEDRGSEVLLSVRDNGIGIDPQYADRVFTIFQRLHTRQEYPGTGVGLSICKKIVERHGGRIWFEGAPAGGTVFHFTLPAAPKDALAGADAASGDDAASA